MIQREARLEAVEDQFFVERAVVVFGHAPFFVVIGDVELVFARPGAAGFLGHHGLGSEDQGIGGAADADGDAAGVGFFSVAQAVEAHKGQAARADRAAQFADVGRAELERCARRRQRGVGA